MTPPLVEPRDVEFTTERGTDAHEDGIVVDDGLERDVRADAVQPISIPRSTMARIPAA